jgi:hypothetical protein
MCALLLNDPQATVCRLFNRIKQVRGGGVNGFVSWSNTLSLIDYQGVDPIAVVKATDIHQVMRFNEKTKQGTFEFMKFKLAKWDVAGNWLGYEDLGYQFNFCNAVADQKTSKSPRWLKFGVSTSETFSCDLQRLLASVSNSTILYQLLVVDQSNGNLFPCPVRVLNLQSSGIYVNVNLRDTDISNDVLTSRFFLVDAMTSITELGGKPVLIR